jgi:hypothetical protein
MATPAMLGSHGLAVPRLGLGCGLLGATDADALVAVAGAWDAGTRYFDTAPWYGKGLSEQRLGLALHSRPREEYTLTTKVGRFLRPIGREGGERDLGDAPHSRQRDTLRFNVEFDYSAAAIRRQHADSLQAPPHPGLLPSAITGHDPPHLIDMCRRSGLWWLRNFGDLATAGTGSPCTSSGGRGPVPA